MARLKKLARSGHWEVDVIPAPHLDPSAGVVVVVDRTHDVVRRLVRVEEGEPLDPHVRLAATDPMGGARPGRPRTLRCRAELADAMRAVVADFDAKLLVTERLDGIERVAEMLAEEAAQVAPALPTSPDLWRPAVDRLVESAPWEVLPEAMGFRFVEGPGLLEQAFGIVTGAGGQGGGFVLYATDDDLDEFVTQLALDADALSTSFLCWCVHLVDADELPQPVVTLATEQRLVWGHRVLQVFAMDAEGARPLSPSEEIACLATLQGLQGAFEQHGEDLEEIGCVATVTTVLGPVRFVTADPDPLPDTLVEGTIHARIEGTVLTVTAAPEVAAAIVAAAEGTDGLQLHGTGASVGVVLWAGERCIGALAELVGDLAVWNPWLETGAGVVQIVAGADPIAQYAVDLLEPVGLDVGPEAP